jgi:hypothetical protein
MEGDISLLSIPDLLQMICLGGYNRDIHLFDGPTQLGVIGIRNGHIDRCFGFGMWGESAFFKLIQLCRGRYKVNDAQDMSASDATLTAYSWQELLMEAARREDEEARVVQAQSTATGRVIAFPSQATHTVPYEAAAMRSGAMPASGPMSVPASGPMSVPASGPMSVPASGPMFVPASAARAVSTGVPATDSLYGASSGAVVAAVVDDHASAERMPSDVSSLLEEATACYLRRDLVRAEALLQQFLVLHPGDKRALQNLERIRRKKTT